MAKFASGWNRLFVVLTLLAIAAPGVATLAGVDRAPAGGENRELAPWPRVGWDAGTLRAWPGAAARYFEDHFAFRARLVRWQAVLRLEWLGVSPSTEVLVGRDGWLFYSADGGLDDFASAVPFSREDLETWRQTLQHTSDWLKGQGVAYLFVLAPDKHAVYPEFMPAGVRRVGAGTRTDALVRYLRDHSTVAVLDLRPALLEAKPRERLYHRTDTHWNDRGAFVAYQQVMERLAALSPPVERPRLVAQPRSAFEQRTFVEPGMDLAGMLGLTDRMREEDLRLTRAGTPRWRVVAPERPDPHGIEPRLITEHEDATRPRAIVLRDSFGSALIPFLSEHFSRAVYLWQYNLEPALVLEERPDVVVQEVVGRRLTSLLPYDAVAALPGVSSTGAARR